MGIERIKELRRRRSRQKKMGILKRKLQTATFSEKGLIANKLRQMTPGAQVIIGNWELEER